jgi:hypothetical protein
MPAGQRSASCLALATFLAFVAAAGPDSPGALQARGIARLEHVRDEFRESGLQPIQQLSELNIAAKELALSYREFSASHNLAQAAWSLTNWADCERQTALFAILSSNGTAMGRGQRAEALASSAREHYQDAAALARKTGKNLYLVKALTGLALVYETQNSHRARLRSCPKHLSASVRVEG